MKGASDDLLDSYEAERRPIAAGMLGLATKLLDAAKAGSMRRGREVHQLDLCYPDTVLNFAEPLRDAKILAGDRAPDAPIRGRAGQHKGSSTYIRARTGHCSAVMWIALAQLRLVPAFISTWLGRMAILWMKMAASMQHMAWSLATGSLCAPMVT